MIASFDTKKAKKGEDKESASHDSGLYTTGYSGNNMD